MNNSPYVIELQNLALMLIPLIAVFLIYIKMGISPKGLAYASGRMLAQLFGIGFVLAYIFELDQWFLSLLILGFMLLTASWIATRPAHSRKREFKLTIAALLLGCIPVLALVIFGVLRIDPWYKPSYLIPLAGMIFSNAMNALSLALDRYEAERGRNSNEATLKIAFESSMIPLVNSFFAVGLVSLPGMMTGQIIAGVSPFVAARYQIVVMAMMLGASGISVFVYLSMKNNSANL